MLKMTTRTLTIRVWRQEEEVKNKYDNSDIVQRVNLLHEREQTPSQVAKMITTMPRVNAVEVLDREGNGPLIYNDWP